jgi:formate--tetrahydrofolate ligase
VRDLVAKSEPQFKPLYDWNWPIEKKIATVAHEMYGAQAVDYTGRAKRDLAQLEKAGFGNLPVCIAKTQQSLSDNPALLGRPKDFLVTVREIQLAAGAGFVVPITGEIMRMPGLPKEPLAGKFDLSDDGEILFER